MKKMIFLCWLGFLIACQSNPDGYTIRGKVEGGGNGKAVLFFSSWRDFSGENTVGYDTVEMKDGKFSFCGKLEAPAYATIRICPEGNQPVSLNFFAENKKMDVRADWKDVVDQYGFRNFTKTEVDGSVNNDVYSQLSTVREKLIKTPEYKEYAELQEKLDQLHDTDADAYYRLKGENEELIDRFNQAVYQRQLEMIKENHTIETVVIYLDLLSNDMSLAELESMFNMLSPNVQSSPFADHVKEEMATRRRMLPGQPAPDFTLETPDGNKLSLSDLRGRYVVLDFWASWCRPCRASFPAMKEIYAAYKDKGLEILGISDDSKKEDWLRALEEDQLPWKQVIDEFPEKYKPSKIGTLYGIHYIPALILVDPDGIIVGKAEDKHQLVEWLNERLPV